MKIRIETRNIEKDFMNETLQGQGQQALDSLWQSSWVKASLSKELRTKEKDITAFAERVKKEANAVVVIGNAVVLAQVESLLSAAKTEEDTEIFYLGESLSAQTFSSVIKSIEHKDFALIAVSGGEESVAEKAAFVCIRKLLLEKYGAVGAAEKMAIVCNSKSSYLSTEAAEDQIDSWIMDTYTDDRFLLYSEAMLLPMAVAGLDTDAYIKGFDDMLADPAWDKDAPNIGILLGQSLAHGLGINLWFGQEELKSLSVYMGDLIESWGVKVQVRNIAQGDVINQDNKVNLFLDIAEEENDVALPSFPGCSEDGSLNELFKREMKYAFDHANLNNPTVKIQMEESNAYTFGQFSAFVQLSLGIGEFILNN